MLTFDTERAEAEHLADLLRRAHLEDGVPWDDMAVLVRSGRRSDPCRCGARWARPACRSRSRVTTCRWYGDPAVLPLLDALRAILNLDNDDPAHVDFVDPARAEALLLGRWPASTPATCADWAGCSGPARRRRPGRGGAPAADRATGPRVPCRRRLPRRARRAPRWHGPALAPCCRRPARQLAQAARTAEEVLWLLWSGTGWPERLRGRSSCGGGAARRPHRDLDAVVALFDAAARAEERKDHVGVANFLADPGRPADPRRHPRRARGRAGAAVRLLTAHRAKGLEWRLVVVAHVQQDVWPDLRRALHAAAGRPDPSGRAGAAGQDPRAADRGAPAVLRRLHAAPGSAWWSPPSLAPTTTASSPRGSSASSASTRSPRRRPPRPAAVDGRPGRELRRTVADPDTARPLREAAAPAAGPAWRGETVGDRLARAAGRPAAWWGTRAATLSAQPGPRPPTSRCRSRPACSVG